MTGCRPEIGTKAFSIAQTADDRSGDFGNDPGTVFFWGTTTNVASCDIGRMATFRMPRNRGNEVRTLVQRVRMVRGNRHAAQTRPTAHGSKTVAQTRGTIVTQRTTCACDLCAVGCRTAPGSLVPADVKAIVEYVGPDDPAQFVWDNFRASEGAIIVRNGKRERVPSIVPAQRPDGGCVFLQNDGGCAIHPVSPWGCRMTDMHQTDDDANRRSADGIRQTLCDKLSGGPYATLQQSLLPARPLVDRKMEFAREESRVRARQN